MHDTAEHLVSNVFSEVPVRQWVVTFPFNIRYIFGYQNSSISEALQKVINIIDSFYRLEAKKRGIQGGKTGAVTCIQRFGSALNLNVHFHILFADGVWDEKKSFHHLSHIEDVQIQELLQQIRFKVLTSLHKKGFLDESHISEINPLELNYLGQAECLYQSITQKNSDKLGQTRIDNGWHPIEGDLCKYLEGFTLNAKVKIEENDREGLLYLCRYILRPAISNERLTLANDDVVILKLKRPFNDGTTHLRFSCIDFIKRLIALVPPPRSHIVRYHGVYAPNAKDRDYFVGKSQKTINVVREEEEQAGETIKCNPYRIAWAKLLKKVFSVEIEQCPCGGKLKVIAAVLDTNSTAGILKSLGMEVFFPNPEPSIPPPK